jgi:antitoxin (DNA-binding transcriptional repressor) of toxin-antitoxin stability system
LTTATRSAPPGGSGQHYRPWARCCQLRVLGRYDAFVNAAFEVSPDDPQGLAEAIQRAARGVVVHLMRDGQAVADIVPAASAQANEAGCNERALSIERRQAERFGAPTLADYRKVYQTSGWPWPGDDAIRRDYLIADAC